MQRGSSRLQRSLAWRDQRIPRVVRSATLIALGFLAVSPARATCDLPRLVRSLTPDGYSYVSTPGYSPGPGQSSASNQLKGSFWILGSGDPALDAGIDNGSFPALAGGELGYYYDGWVSLGPGYGAGISTTWAASEEIDNCVDDLPGQQCLAVLFSDRDAAGNGYFALLTDQADLSRNFDFVQPDNAPIVLLSIPPPDVADSTPTGPLTVEIDVISPATLDPALYLDPVCPEGVVLGYKLRSTVLPRGTAPPSDPDIALWDDLHPGGPVALGLPTTVSVSCNGTSDIYLATSLVFESGFELQHVSSSSAGIPCGDCSGTDADGDGYCVEAEPGLTVDCDDADPDIFPLAPQICDGANNDCLHPGWPALGNTTETDDDGDGLSECTGDCDDDNAAVLPGGLPICDGVNNNCSDPIWPALGAEEVDTDSDGFSTCGGDCDDGEATVFPGAQQLCDGLNNDCDDPSWPAVPAAESDADGDFHFACSDCDDAAGTVFPGAPQLCDGLNNDCDHPSWPGLAGTSEFDDDGDGLSECELDCDDAFSTVFPGAPQLCSDELNNDCGHPNWPALAGTNEIDDDLDGFNECVGDCDDANGTIRPGGVQICDGANNDCLHPNWPALDGTNEVDEDGDGLAGCEGDCVRNDADVYPGAPQICDGVNNDCSAPFWPSISGTNEEDSDGDTFSECEGDCSPGNATVYPGAPPFCDGLNNDCSDPNWPDLEGSEEADGDGDGYIGCLDCDDTDATVFPLAPQICDGLNNDCGDPDWPTPPTTELDADGDEFSFCEGDCEPLDADVYPAAPQICDGLNNDCLDPQWPSPPPDEVDNDNDLLSECDGDCDDSNAQILPGAFQLCDGVNNDCLDPEWPLRPPDEFDADNDGFFECEGDCDDGAADVNPAAEEICNGIDDDCDGAVDGLPGGVGPDTDGDTIGDFCDNCIDLYNPSQTDTDMDGIGSSCDNCTIHPNPDQLDFDLDEVGDACDNCPVDFNVFQGDVDFDRVGDACDNCFFTYNPNQSNTEPDPDEDGDHCDFDDGLILIEFFEREFVDWQGDEQGFGAWNWYRGDLDQLRLQLEYTQLPGSNPVAAQECDLVQPFVADPGIPDPDKVIFYLVSGLDGNGEHDLGTNSAGVLRSNDNPCP